MDVETALAEYDVAATEVRRIQQQLDAAIKALADAAENYGAALAREAEQ
jgi:hypothetical protein